MKRIWLYLFTVAGAVAQQFFPQGLTVEPLTVHLSGVMSNGRSVVAWGDHGTLLTSLDRGDTWQKFIVNDSVSVVGVCSMQDGTLYAICSRRYAAISRDDGQNWERIELDNAMFYQCSVIGDRLYVLSDRAIWVFDRWLTKLAELSIEQDTAISSMCTVAGKLVYSGGKGKLLIYDPTSGQPQLIDLGSRGYCYDCPPVVRLFGSNTDYAYFMMGDRLFFVNVTTGEVGDIVQLSLPSSSALFARNRAVYFLRSQQYTTVFNFYGPDSIFCARIDRLTKEWTELRAGENDRYIIGAVIGAAAFVGGDTIIAVGNYSLIWRSPDAGRRWELLSLLPPSSRSFVPIDEKFIYAIADPYLVSHTTDGGVTWRPQKTYPANFINAPRIPGVSSSPFDRSRETVYLFRDRRSGIVVQQQLTVDHINNMSITTDGGETFHATEYRTSNGGGVKLIGFIHRGLYGITTDYCLIGGGNCYSVFELFDDQLHQRFRTWYSGIRAIWVGPISDTLYAVMFDTTLGRYMYALWRFDEQMQQWGTVMTFQLPPSWRDDRGTEPPGTLRASSFKVIGRSLFFYTGVYDTTLSKWNMVLYRLDPFRQQLTQIYRAEGGLLNYIVGINRIGGAYIVREQRLFQRPDSTRYLGFIDFVTENVESDQPQWREFLSRRYSLSGNVSALGDSVWYVFMVDSVFNNRNLYALRNSPEVSAVETQSSVQTDVKPWLSPPIPQPVSENTRLVLYYNPADWSSKGPAQAKVYSLQGSEVAAPTTVYRTSEYTANVDIDCTNLPVGVYVCVVRLGSWRMAQQIIVVR